MDRRLGLDELVLRWVWWMFRLGEPEPLTGVTVVTGPLVLVVTASETSIVGSSSDFTACCKSRTTPAREVMVWEDAQEVPHTNKLMHRTVGHSLRLCRKHYAT